MGFSGASLSTRATALVCPLVVLAVAYPFWWLLEEPAAFFRPLGRPSNSSIYFLDLSPPPSQAGMGEQDYLEAALEGVSMGNRTAIIAVLNRAYVQPNAILDLFLRSLREGEGTQFLLRHILFAAIDDGAFNRCRALGLHCYNLTATAGGADLSHEVFYMSDAFNEMMWRRTLFLGDVLRRGYSFVFTDVDVMWLRNPFPKLRCYEGTDLVMSSDIYYGRPFNNSNFNTGFYFVVPNNRTVALFDEWYARRNSSRGMKDQDVLLRLKKEGAFKRLGLKVRYMETGYFSGFCQMSRDYREVLTVHANCCVSMRAKLADLAAVLEAWKQTTTQNPAANATWPPTKGICLHDTSAKF